MQNELKVNLCKDCVHSYGGELSMYWCKNPVYAPPSPVDGKPKSLMCIIQRGNNIDCPEYVQKEQEVKKETLVAKVLHWFKPKVQ